MEKVKILIVENDIESALTIARILLGLGYETINHADTIEKAITIVEEDAPDLLLMNYLIKGKMDVIEAIEMIQSQFQLPVIVTARCLNEASTDKINSAEPSGVIQKPIQDWHLKVTIASALRVVREKREKNSTEEALLNVEDHLFLTMQTAQIGTFEWDIVNNRNHWSDEACCLFGIDAKNFGDRYEDYLGFIPKGSRERIDRLIRKSMIHSDDSNILHFDHEIIRGDTKIAWIEVRARLVKDEQGRPIRFSGIVIDITERKKQENEIQEKQTKLETYTKQLEEMNTTLKVIMNEKNREKEVLEHDLLVSFKKLVLPYFDVTSKLSQPSELKTVLEVLEHNTKEILFKDTHDKNTVYEGFTLLESQIATLISEQKSTKEIAAILDTNPRNIYFHRDNIRKKLNISKKNTNLKKCLQSLN